MAEHRVVVPVSSVVLVALLGFVLLGPLAIRSHAQISPQASQDESSVLAQCANAAASWWNGRSRIEFDAIDPDAAVGLCEAATREGSADAWAFLARALSRAQRFEEMWNAIERAIEGGSATGWWARAGAYQLGDGVSPDPEEAERSVREAARQGSPNGQFTLGSLLLERDASPEEFNQGVRLVRQAAEAGLAGAQTVLGTLYQDYRALEPPPILEWEQEAIRWFTAAAEQGEVGAMVLLAEAHADGAGVPRDPDRAVVLIGRALQVQNVERRQGVLQEARRLGLDITEALLAMVDDPSPVMRQEVGNQLAMSDNPRAIEGVAILATDPEDAVRQMVAQGLGFSQHPGAAAILQSMMRDPERGVADTALDSLEAVDPAAASAALGSLDGPLRPEVASGLVRSGGNDVRVIDALITGLRDDDVETRRTSALGLAVSADTRAVEPLIEALQDPEADIRRRAADGLQVLGDRRGVEGLTPALRDTHPAVRDAAVRALGDLGDASIVEALLAGLDEPELQPAIIQALGRLRDTRAVDSLLSFLDDDELGEAAAEALGLIGDARAIEPLLALAARGSEAGWTALSMMDGPTIAPLMLQVLEAAPELWSLRDAQRSISRVRDSSLAERVSALLASPVPAMRAAAAETMGRIAFENFFPMDRPRMVSLLAGALRDPDADVRREAAQALGEFSDPAAVGPLIERLDDPDPVLQDYVIGALGYLGDRRAVEPIMSVLEEISIADEVTRQQKGLVQLSAIISLGKLQDPRATALVSSLASEDGVATREAVAKALGEIGDPGGLETLERLASDADFRVSSTARDALAAIRGERAELDQSAEVMAAVESLPFGSDGALLTFAQDVWRLQGEAAKNAILLERAQDLIDRAEGGLIDPALAGAAFYVRSRLDASNEQWERSLAYADRGLALVADRQVAQRVVLNWLRAEAYWRIGQAGQSLETVDHIERELLPRINAQERRLTGLPFASHTLQLRAAALLALDRPLEARQAAEAAERALRFEGPRGLPFYLESSLRKTIPVYLMTARSEFARAELADVAREGIAVRQTFAQSPATTAFEASAERLALETAIKTTLATAGDNPALWQAAHTLAEQLQLKSQPAPDGVTPGDSTRRAATAELASLRESWARLDREVSAASAATDAALLDELRRARNVAQQRIQAFVVQLKRDHPEVSAFLGAEPAELRVVQPHLAPDTRLLQYVLLPEQGWVFVMSERDIRVFPLPSGLNELAPLIDRYRRQLTAGVNRRRPSGSATDATRSDVILAAGGNPLENLAADVARIVLAPISDQLDGVTSLVIVPNGPLHRLPFASLPWQDGHLVEAFDLRVLPSSSSLPVVDRPFVERGVVVLGNPTPPSTDWAPLPAAELEAREVAAMYGARAFVGADARRETIVGRDLSGQLLHLALHAQAGDSDATRLVLSDGYVTVSEVWGMSLEGSPLVVLSACQTALGEQLSGDEVVSLAKGFMFAGARAVVSTLWAVDDDSTRELMTAFHRGRQQGTAGALADAQRALIKQGYGPYHWAGFTLSGW